MYITLNSAFSEIGYTRSQTDWSVHFRHEKNTLVGLLGTIVDDIILSTKTKSESDRFATELARRFATSDKGDLVYAGGATITRW